MHQFKQLFKQKVNLPVSCKYATYRDSCV